MALQSGSGKLNPDSGGLGFHSVYAQVWGEDVNPTCGFTYPEAVPPHFPFFLARQGLHRLQFLPQILISGHVSISI